MAIQEKLVDYDCDGTVCEALMVWDDAIAGARPGVLVAHAWGGRSDFEDGKARALAAQGYVGFALDVYGKGRRGSNNARAAFSRNRAANNAVVPSSLTTRST